MKEDKTGNLNVQPVCKKKKGEKAELLRDKGNSVNEEEHKLEEGSPKSQYEMREEGRKSSKQGRVPKQIENAEVTFMRPTSLGQPLSAFPWLTSTLCPSV